MYQTSLIISLIAESAITFWILLLCSHLNESLTCSCELGKKIRKTKREGKKKLGFAEGCLVFSKLKSSSNPSPSLSYSTFCDCRISVPTPDQLNQTLEFNTIPHDPHVYWNLLIVVLQHTEYLKLWLTSNSLTWKLYCITTPAASSSFAQTFSILIFFYFQLLEETM